MPNIAVINRTRRGLLPFLGLASVATISELLISSGNSGYDMEIRLPPDSEILLSPNNSAIGWQRQWPCW